ncbi:MAG: hypothetical protein DMD26_01125, partial [Gemmatimonadetes bacterium]
AILLSVAVGCGILWTLQSYAYLRIRNRLGHYTLTSLTIHDVTAALLWACLAPAVFAATSRFPLTRSRLRVRAPLYLTATAVLAIVHAAVLLRLFSRQVPLWSADNTNTLILNFLIIGVLVGIGHRRQLSEWLRERELAAATLSAEVRAARLRAARLQCIPPVVLDALDRVIEAVSTTPSPRRTEQLLARLGDYLRVAIECSDEQGVTSQRERSLARSLTQLERLVGTTATSSSLTTS